jgi:hypothetical protein
VSGGTRQTTRDAAPFADPSRPALLAAAHCSPAFARELTRLIADELRGLADEKVKDVVDVGLIHDLIERSEKLVAVDALSGLMVTIGATVRRRVRKTKRSLEDVLGESSSVTSKRPSRREILLAMPTPSRACGRDLCNLMTDLVYTAIVSFNRRVNPLFGSLALMAVDAQIKSFIRMFMPMLQRQATAFLIDRKHHALFADFARAALREVLREPLPQLAELRARQRRRRAPANRAQSTPAPTTRDGARMVSARSSTRPGRKRVGTVPGRWMTISGLPNV